MEFLFAEPDDIDKEGLRQGDLLAKTRALSGALSQAHQYYATASDYTHFLVLTQSCDLVRRNGKAPKARYITVAAVRPLKTVIDRFLAKHEFGDFEFPVLLCKKDRELLAQQLLERLLHNTCDGHFFIRKDSVSDIDEDLCAFLALSVALKNIHYDACLSSKVAQLEDIFAAKVGWLTGSLYSRVATPDIEELLSEPEVYKAAFYDETLYNRTAWLSPAQFRHLKKLVQAWRKDNPHAQLDLVAAQAIIDNIPEDVTFVAERVFAVLSESGLVSKNEAMRDSVINTIQPGVALRRLIRSDRN